MAELLKRKIDEYLLKWKADSDRLPLIVKGARQIGKTASIRDFGEKNYASLIEINFALDTQYMHIFDQGFSVDTILKNISLQNPSLEFIPHKTLIFFDEMQLCSNCATSLKAFKMDGRYDVICSGSLMGINYKEIVSNSVGYKTDYKMHSMDFEEFLWAKGYTAEHIEDMYKHMLELTPFSQGEMDVYREIFLEYCVLGGMPAIVNRFIKNKHFSGTLKMQKDILLDYEEDITKYAHGMDKARILNVYRKLAVFLGKDNKKFQISKISKGARNREYIGAFEWLDNSGIINICYCLNVPELPLKGNYDPSNYKVYYADTGLLIGSLDDEVQEDLRANRNLNAYKGGIYENIVADMLVKEGYSLYYYKNNDLTIEMDFFVRDVDSLIPIEVKASNHATPSLKKLVEQDKYPDIRYGIKLCAQNIGYNGKFYTFPYFTTFLLKRFLREHRYEKKQTM